MFTSKQHDSFVARVFSSSRGLFAPYYEDPRGFLFKLTQKGFVQNYLNDVKRLANRIVGLPITFLLSNFISCLTPDIHHEVQALQPHTLT